MVECVKVKRVVCLDIFYRYIYFIMEADKNRLNVSSKKNGNFYWKKIIDIFVRRLKVASWTKLLKVLFLNHRSITAKYYLQVMRSHGFNPTEEELSDMIRSVDTNRN